MMSHHDLFFPIRSFFRMAAYFVFAITIGSSALYSQGVIESNFDANAFTAEVQNRILNKVSAELENALSKGEEYILDQIYFEEILEPYKEFGIDPRKTDYYKEVQSIYLSIRNDPNYDPKTDFKEFVRSALETRLSNYFGSYIEEDSKEIAGEIFDLVRSGNQKVQSILESVSSIEKFDSQDPNIEAKIASEFKKWGLKGTLADFIEDLEHTVGGIQQAASAPVEVTMRLVSIVTEKDPTAKIEAFFAFGEDYGGKVPVVGDVASNLFKLGRATLAAAKRAGGLLEKNFGQGCISEDGEYVFRQEKKAAFYQRFPNVTRACPLEQSMSMGVYYHIYYDVNNASALFFYNQGTWLGESVSGRYYGVQDIKAIRRWLRSIGEFAKADDIGFLYDSYVKSPGFTHYRNELETKMNEIQFAVKQTMSDLNVCSEKSVVDLLMHKVDINWLNKLMRNSLNSVDLRFFDQSMAEQMIDQMTRNRYINGGRDNLDHLDRIIDNLKDHTPVEIYGKVTDAAFLSMSGASISLPGLETLLLRDQSCVKLETDQLGNYRIILLLPEAFSGKIDLTTSYAGLQQDHQIQIDVSTQRHYSINLTVDRNKESVADMVKCEEKEGHLWLEDQSICVPDISCEIENTVKVYDQVSGTLICDCPEPYQWNTDRTICGEVSTQEDGEDEVCPDDRKKMYDGECRCKDEYYDDGNGHCLTLEEMEDEAVSDGELDKIPCDQFIEKYRDVTESYISSVTIATEIFTEHAQMGSKFFNDRIEDPCIDARFLSSLSIARRERDFLLDIGYDIQNQLINNLTEGMHCPDGVRDFVQSMSPLITEIELVNSMYSNLYNKFLEFNCKDEEIDDLAPDLVQDPDRNTINEGTAEREGSGGNDADPGEGVIDGLDDIVVTQQNVNIRIWDHSCEDEDIITLKINDEIIFDNLEITNAGTAMDVVVPVGRNILELTAISGGRDCPNGYPDSNPDYSTTKNSASIFITHATEGGSQQWTLLRGVVVRVNFIVAP